MNIGPSISIFPFLSVCRWHHGPSGHAAHHVGCYRHCRGLPFMFDQLPCDASYMFVCHSCSIDSPRLPTTHCMRMYGIRVRSTAVLALTKSTRTWRIGSAGNHPARCIRSADCRVHPRCASCHERRRLFTQAKTVMHGCSAAAGQKQKFSTCHTLCAHQCSGARRGTHVWGTANSGSVSAPNSSVPSSWPFPPLLPGDAIQ